jgi:peptidoglycan/LPS O-acetylase OafA/YrhL
MLELAGIELSWRIRPYNAAEPFWTIAIEMWIYVAMGLFCFCLVWRERVNRRYALLLALISVPVFVWNAAAGGGKSLSLIWILGAIAGLLLHLWRDTPPASIRPVAYALIVCGMLALIGRAGKIGFQPYDLQTAALLAIVLFGILARLMAVESAAPAGQRVASFLASYSYSLYLVHNTALIIVLEHLDTASGWVRVMAGVVLAHCCAYLLYLAFERHYRTVGRWLRPRFERALRPHAAPTGVLPSAAMLSTPGRHTR